MTEEIKKLLPEILRKHICTLKKASLDDANREYMCESRLEVVDFDKIPQEYARGKGWSGVPSSNDALYISPDQEWYFIEFKNGEVKKDQVYKKMYDSLVMLLEMKIVPDFEFIRNKISYILVYNALKYTKVPDSPGRNQNYSYFFRLAEQEERLFDIDKFEKYLFAETHTYTQSLFEEKFIMPMENEEGLYV